MLGVYYYSGPNFPFEFSIRDLALRFPKSGTIQNRQLSSQAIYEIIRQRAEQASIESCKPHDLRRTFVTQLLEAGVDINTARLLAGHTDIQTTARYDLRDEKSPRKAIKHTFFL